VKPIYGGKSSVLTIQSEGQSIWLKIDEKSANKTMIVDGPTGETAVGAVANVMKEEDIEAMVNKAVDQLGTVDILVNNAGVMDNFRRVQ
jgi:NADP-dependent 3-hydroxy acid dehydrogenase YdfG